MYVWKKVIVIYNSINHPFIRLYFLDIPKYVNVYTFSFFCGLPRYEITQKTAWYFMQKLRKAMENSKQYLMEGDVNVEEFVVGWEGGRQKRSKVMIQKK